LSNVLVALVVEQVGQLHRLEDLQVVSVSVHIPPELPSVHAGGKGVLCGGEGRDNTKLYLYDVGNAKPVTELGNTLLSSEGVRMMGATDVGHVVSSVQVNSSGRFVAATGGRGSITVSKSILQSS
jgi:hypothetical protein